MGNRGKKSGKKKVTKLKKSDNASISTANEELLPNTMNAETLKLNETCSSSASGPGVDQAMAGTSTASYSMNDANLKLAEIKIEPVDISEIETETETVTDFADVQCVAVNGISHVAMRSDGHYYYAKIIDQRLSEVQLPKGAEDDVTFGGSSETFDYYVHYENLDRRLDEWVPRIRLMTIAEASKCGIIPINTAASHDVSQSNTNDNRKITRSRKRIFDETHHVQEKLDEMSPVAAKLEKEHEAATKVKQIDVIQFGRYEIDTWYVSQYPEPFNKAKKLFICEYCLKYTASLPTFRHHVETCKIRQPPGKEIYRKGTISFYEVDGSASAEDKLYCQNLCLVCKLFLDHKSVCFPVQDFLFYVLCEVDREGAHFVGYFSKEKNSENNVACILTMPHHQQKGFGKLLISFSYVLSKREGVLGSPERPLSDLGKRTYRSYWMWTILSILQFERRNISIKELSQMTSITQADIIDTLQAINMIKFWKGQYIICVAAKVVREFIQKNQLKPPRIAIDVAFLRWAPPPKPTLKIKKK